MRRAPDARPRRTSPSASLLLSFALLAPGCDRKDEPLPSAAPPPPGSAASAPTERPPRPMSSASAAAAASAAPPVPSPPPDVRIDPTDPAREYVARYVRATHRYGDKAACVVVAPSTFVDGKSLVETRNDASGACGKADDVRDRFRVTLATDRMSLDDSLHQPKLQPWPDGSDPDGPPKAVADVQDLRKWKSKLGEAFRHLQLAPLRVQLYGRGSYPVISIAGWHGPVLRGMSPAELEAPAKALCEASDGDSMGVFAGVDRWTILRITCPGSARFESL